MHKQEIEDNKARILEEAYRQSVLRMEAQERRMLAADQRALVFAAVAVASAAFMTETFQESSDGDFGLGLASMFLFVISAIFSVLAARATGIAAAHPPFRAFEQYLSGKFGYLEVYAEFGRQNDCCHTDNEKHLRLSNRLYNFAMFIFVTGLVAAGIRQVLSTTTQ